MTIYQQEKERRGKSKNLAVNKLTQDQVDYMLSNSTLRKKQIRDALDVFATITIQQTLAHTGTHVGFFGATPTTQTGAYTQTYATATRTLSSYTPDSQGVSYTGIDNAQPGSVYAQSAELEDLRVAYENLRLLTENMAQVLNQVIDDLQSYGLLQ